MVPSALLGPTAVNAAALVAEHATPHPTGADGASRHGCFDAAEGSSSTLLPALRGRLLLEPTIGAGPPGDFRVIAGTKWASAAAPPRMEALLPQKVGLDRLYASRMSLRRDAKVLVATFVTLVLRQPVAVHRDTAALSLRRRPNALVEG